jgi:hypothetical protein
VKPTTRHHIVVNVQDIKDRLVNGFRPFELHLTNGRRVPVVHPDYIIVSRRTVVVVTPEDDRVSIIDPLHIVSIDPLPGTT